MLPRFVGAILILSLGSSSFAGSLSAQGQASGPADRAVILMFLKTEAHPDGSSEPQLAQAWSQAKAWLGNFGIKDEQITLRPLVTRLFQDQKKYLIQRLAITIKLDPAKKDQDLENLAQLVDQSSARGMLPVSQLALLAQEQESIGPTEIPDGNNHFIFFLPADQQQLVDQAMRDGFKSMRRDCALLAAAAKLENPKLTDLHVENAALQSTDLKAGVIGLASTSMNDVRVYAPLSAEFAPASAATPGGQSLSVTGSARIEIPPDRAIIQTRVSTPDASLQKALDRIVDKTRRFEEKASTAGEDAKIDLGGVAFFSGNPGMGSGEPVEGAVPSGVYRDIRITMDRHEGESEPAFRKRVEKLASSLHPSPTPETPNLNDNPYFQVVWGPKDSTEFRAAALKAAMADAANNARRSLAAFGGKLGSITDIDINPVENPAMTNNPYIQAISSALPLGSDSLVAHAHLGDKPSLAITVNVKYSAEIP